MAAMTEIDSSRVFLASDLPERAQASLLKLGFSLTSNLSAGLAASWCATFGHQEALSHILEAFLGESPTWRQPRFAAALGAASRRGQEECVQIILARGDASFFQSPAAPDAFLRAIAHGQRRCAQLLAPFSNASENNGRALALAALHGHVDILEDLMATADMLLCGRPAIMSAINHGQEACARLLIPHVDLAERSFEILAAAIAQGHAGILHAIASAIPHARSVEFFEPWIAHARQSGRAGSAQALLSLQEAAALSERSAAGLAARSPRRI